MTDTEKLAALRALLEDKAANATRFEEYGPDYCPAAYENNAEDGYRAGADDGETLLARELLAMLKGY